MLMPGDCKVIGGPMADPMANGLPMDFMFFNAMQFNPVLPNGTMASAEGVALFKGTPPAMRCSRNSRRGCSAACASPIPWPGSPVMSS